MIKLNQAFDEHLSQVGLNSTPRANFEAAWNVQQVKIDALIASNKAMLHIFDRGLEQGMVGRRICDETIETIAKAES